MKSTVRVSFDVPIEEHTYLKTVCVEAHIHFRDLMREHFHKMVSEIKTKELHELLTKSIKDKRKSTPATAEFLDDLERKLI